MYKSEEHNQSTPTNKGFTSEGKGSESFASRTKRKTNKYHKLISSSQWMALGVLFIGICVFFYTNHLFYKYDENRIRLLTHLNNEQSSLAATLSDGSIVCLTKNSFVKCSDKFNNGNRLVEFNGNALFDIAPHELFPFIIDMDHVNIRAIGTNFVIDNLYNDTLVLSVKQGMVQLTHKTDGQHYYVNDGEALKIASDGQVSYSPISSSELFSNYIKSVRFNNEALNKILYIVNMNDSLTISLSPAARRYGEQRLSIELDNSSPLNTIRQLSEALNLDYIQNEEGYILLD